MSIISEPSGLIIFLAGQAVYITCSSLYQLQYFLTHIIKIICLQIDLNQIHYAQSGFASMRRRLALKAGEAASEFRLLASKERNGLSARRLLALALCRENALERRAIASFCGLNVQALRDLVVRYNLEGISAIYNKKGAGKPPHLSPDKHARFKEIVEAGADITQDGVVRWRIIDLAARVKAEFGVDYCESSIANLLKKLNFSHISARPQHPKADKAVQETFKKTSRAM